MEKVPEQNHSSKGGNSQDIKEATKKFIFNTDDSVPGLEHLPPEASELIKNIMSTDILKKTPVLNEKVVMESLSPEQTLAKAPQMDQQAQDLLRRMVIQEKLIETGPKTQSPPKPPDSPKIVPASKSVPPPPPVTKSPPPPPTASPLRPFFEDVKNITIDEKGSVFGIQINRATRKEVIEIMKSRSKIANSENNKNIMKYEDLGINYYFANNILQEITFSYPFEGSTSKGLQIEDSISKAITLYGQPKMRTQAGAIWDKVAVFLKDDIVTTIRLRSI